MTFQTREKSETRKAFQNRKAPAFSGGGAIIELIEENRFFKGGFYEKLRPPR